MIVTGEEVGRWVVEKAGGNGNYLYAAIGEIKDGKLIAGVVYDNFTKSSICIHSRIDKPKLVSREFYWAVFNYPFNQLKVTRLTGIVKTSNEKAISLNEKLGFKREALLRKYFPNDDAIIYVMWPEDCRFLRLGKRYAK